MSTQVPEFLLPDIDADYTIGYRKRKSNPMVIRPISDGSGFMTRTARIAQGVGGKWVHRDGGYTMSLNQAVRFRAALGREGLDYSPITKTWHGLQPGSKMP